MTTDYQTFRGKCRELSEAACAEDPTLTLVRGHYFCPIWNRTEPHWWTVRPDGTIHDPSARQFPSAGLGYYEPFDGMVDCENCGRSILEEDGHPCGRYVCCSERCCLRLVGL